MKTILFFFGLLHGIKIGNIVFETKLRQTEYDKTTNESCVYTRIYAQKIFYLMELLKSVKRFMCEVYEHIYVTGKEVSAY